jgi:PAS domain-containing protein
MENLNHEIAAHIPDWVWGMNCAVTVCDADCRIIYMNRRARDTFAAHGDLIGCNLRDCHSPRSVEIIERLLRDGGTNCYTISKAGLRKMIFQTAWRHRRDDSIGGLVELSMVIPEEMPHYIRD